ncbi:hypothetical protein METBISCDRAFT_11885 [Metschnikowia bicuspidata]|uniref:Mitochondrial group I intron splicing factor CCM1 n=1 Tax=Metschnikowia bicuspidata TaxID=27322 RepID=A0A4V1J3N4_9ASCO|nr:hypothetical protein METBISCDRAFT_11885 [Metschnikowia bicuspidata]
MQATLSKIRCFSHSARNLAAEQSQVRWKLKKFVETGEIKRLSDSQAARRSIRAKEKAVRALKQNGISPQKALLLLRLKYDAVPLQTSDGQPINLHTLKPSSLTMTGDMLAKVYDALMEMKRVTRCRLNDAVLMVLLGALPTLVRDAYFVTRDVLKLLKLDQNPNRALELCRIARKNASVGMNAILEWSLEKHDLKLARKVLVHGSKWGIPTTDHTHVLYFSGVADMYEWRRVPDDVADEVYESLSSAKMPKKVEVFNAALKVLVKNYTDDQKKAWLFFDKYVENGLDPDCHTFTIFLNGCKKFYAAKSEQTRDDRTLSARERSTRLYEIHAQLVLIAETVLLKLLEAATPPVPPTKEQALQNPELLKQYRTASYLFRNHVDRVFASTFLSCFTSDSFGTGISSKNGPNHAYLLRTLFYLQAWVPETRDLVHNSNTQTVIETIAPKKEIERRTASREATAEVPDRFRPEKVLQPLTLQDVNPNVVFPPSPLSKNKSSATYSKKTKPLVDFARVSLSTLRKEYQRLLYEKTNGKEGASHPKQNIERDANSINKFLLRIFLETLAKMGCYKEFHLAVWYALNKWGGVAVDLSNVYKNGFEPYPYSKVHVLTRESGKAAKFIASNAGAQDTSKSASSEIIDASLLEDFIFKIEEYFPKAASPSKYAVELLAAACFGSPTTLEVRAKTFDAIFSTLNRDLYAYNELNKEASQRLNSRRGYADNTPKKSITLKQLTVISDNVHVLVKCIIAWAGMNRLTQRHIVSLDSLLGRIYTVTWLDAPETHENCYKIHERLVYSTVLLWRPKNLQSPKNADAFVKSVSKSVDFVYSLMNQREDLSARENKLRLLLQDMFKLDPQSPSAEERLRALQWKIYRLGSGGKDAEVKEVAETESGRKEEKTEAFPGPV